MPRSRSVELNYILSLAALLALAMLMTLLVMLMLWQRDMVQELAIRGKAALTAGMGRSPAPVEAVAGAVELRQQQLQRTLKKTARSAGALCGAIRFNNHELIAGSDDCRPGPLSAALRQALSQGKPITSSVGAAWGVVSSVPRYLIVAVPVDNGPGTTGAAALLLPLAPVYQSIRHSHRLVLAYLLVNLIILTAIGLVRFHKLTVCPMNRLVRLADSYHDPDDETFSMLPERSEFGRLSNALSRMLQRIELDRKQLQATVLSLEKANQSLRDTRQEMVRTEKMASVGRLAAGLAHEIGNPLGIIQGYLGLLGQNHISENEKKDFSSRAEKELQRISALLRQLLDLSRSLPGHSQSVSIHDILTELLSVMQSQPLTEGIDIQSRLGASHDTVQGDPERLRQVFLNCLFNSVDAVRASNSKSGLITVTTKTVPEKTTKAPTEKLCITIEDNGEGIAPADLANVFDPFFTTKEPGKGTGLGLSVSLTIIEDMGGRMELENRKDHGTQVLIRLPCSEV